MCACVEEVHESSLSLLRVYAVAIEPIAPGVGMYAGHLGHECAGQGQKIL